MTNHSAAPASRNEREGKYAGYKGRHRRGGGGYMRERDWRLWPTRRQIKAEKMAAQDNDYTACWPSE